MSNLNDNMTHFGFTAIPAAQKPAKVAEVFHSVASKYDLMNDLMSLGIHRVWKHFAVNLCRFRPGQTVLDIAGGTGDLAARISPLVGIEGSVILADINASMLQIGKDRLINRGLYQNLAFVQADAETLPFPDNYFDRIIIGFGLRNVTQQLTALKSMYRVLKPGGQVIILEFSKPTTPLLKSIYQAYSFNLLPWLGKMIAKDESSYRYLVESIEKHPDQTTLANMLTDANFEDVDYHNLSGGIVAIHRGYKY
jgi:demethylmenaquinone methyltransferase/2-methoxy-6-polyprenyl-1,4-benzoquinol methylase